MNERLSKDAQDYAEHLAKAASSVHSLRKDRPGQGENIAVGCTSAGSELRAKEAISQWYLCVNFFSEHICLPLISVYFIPAEFDAFNS